MKTFKHFLTDVEKLSKAVDFLENKRILYDIDFRFYKDFLNLLRLGASISSAKKGLIKIIEKSIATQNTPSELIELIVWSRAIHYIIDN